MATGFTRVNIPQTKARIRAAALTDRIGGIKLGIPLKFEFLETCRRQNISPSEVIANLVYDWTKRKQKK